MDLYEELKELSEYIQDCATDLDFYIEMQDQAERLSYAADIIDEVANSLVFRKQ